MLDYALRELSALELELKECNCGSDLPCPYVDARNAVKRVRKLLELECDKNTEELEKLRLEVEVKMGRLLR